MILSEVAIRPADRVCDQRLWIIRISAFGRGVIILLAASHVGRFKIDRSSSTNVGLQDQLLADGSDSLDGMCRSGWEPLSWFARNVDDAGGATSGGTDPEMIADGDDVKK
jgi:hypothetical protein